PFTGVCAYYCRRHGAKLVFHVAHDRDVSPAARPPLNLYGLLHSIARRIGELGMRRADHVIVQTKHQANLLRTVFGLDPTLIVRNFHPLPDEHQRAARDRKRVIWVANFKTFKHPERFVALAEALEKRSDIEFVMIGRPGEPTQYRALHERI